MSDKPKLSTEGVRGGGATWYDEGNKLSPSGWFYDEDSPTPNYIPAVVHPAEGSIVDDLRAENERLREALDEVWLETSTDSAPGVENMALDHIARICRRALNLEVDDA